jgi:hypothetical protein
MDRGQVHTLEAIVAALLLLTSVVFALQMTAVTPLSASTSSQHIENQLQASAQGVLVNAADNGEIKPAILAWNRSGAKFHHATQERYYSRFAPPNAFGERLEDAFSSRGIAYNVYLHYYSTGGGTRTDRFVYRGEPSDNAVQAAQTVVLTDSATHYNETMGQTNITVNSTNYFAPDYGEGSAVYNVVRIEVLAWRI